MKKHLETRGRILRALQNLRPAPQRASLKEIAEAAHVSEQTARYHLQKLTDEGAVNYHRVYGGSYIYWTI